MLNFSLKQETLAAAALSEISTIECYRCHFGQTIWFGSAFAVAYPAKQRRLSNSRNFPSEQIERFSSKVLNRVDDSATSCDGQETSLDHIERNNEMVQDVPADQFPHEAMDLFCVGLWLRHVAFSIVHTTPQMQCKAMLFK